MIKLFIILAIHTLAYISLGWTFALVEQNEDIDTAIEAKRNDKWHTAKFITLSLFGAAMAFGLFGLTLYGLIFLVTLGLLAMLVFNISINKFKGNEWYHLSNEGFEGRFKNKKLYYLINFLLLATGIVTLILI